MPSSSGVQEEAAANYGLPTFSQAQVLPFAGAPMQPQPAQQVPQPRRGISGAMIAVIAMLALILIGGSIFAYYVAVIQPAQLHAQATADAQTFLTAQARGTAQAQTRATTQAQATATATTPEVLYAQATSGTPVINDPLSDKNNSSWSEGGKQGNGCTFTGGSYHISATQPGLISCLAGQNSVSDFAFQVQMSIIKGDGGGIDFRISNVTSSTIDAYFLNVSSTGGYALLVSQNGPKLLMRGTSLALKQGLNQSNLLTVIARGDSMYLYMNKQFVTSIKDTTYASGGIGLFVSDLQQPSEVAFSNAELWTL